MAEKDDLKGNLYADYNQVMKNDVAVANNSLMRKSVQEPSPFSSGHNTNPLHQHQQQQNPSSIGIDSRQPSTLNRASSVTSSNVDFNKQFQYSSNIPLSASAPEIANAELSSSPNDDKQFPKLLRSSQSKIETIKKWSISTFKCTKQLMFERLGKTTRTIDSDLETRIENLRDLRRRYMQVLSISRSFTSHFYHVIQTQQALAEVFSELAQKSPELQQEFLYNAETQKTLHKNGETLLNALNFFLSSINTLCNKTIEDTILTIKQYENSRVEYDAYRSEMEVMLQSSIPTDNSRVDETQKKFNIHKNSYEKLREDVNIKLQFLDENRVKVMHKQLLLFHNAIAAYFSGNQEALEATMKQFCIRNPNNANLSWLES